MANYTSPQPVAGDCIILNKPLIFKSKTKELSPFHQENENGQPVVGDCIILNKPLIFKTKTKELSPFYKENAQDGQTKTKELSPFYKENAQDGQDEDCAAYRIPRQHGDVRTDLSE
jgi:hypothetical protein